MPPSRRKAASPKRVPTPKRAPTPAKRAPASRAHLSSSPAKGRRRRGQERSHETRGAKVDAVAARLRERSSAPPAAGATRLGVVLVFWFLTSSIFNDATPRLMRTLEGSGGTNMDVTALELAITVSIAATKLLVEKKRPLPPASLVAPVLGVGASHLLGCRLFIWGLQFIPVSIAQTVRAANPVVTVAFAVTMLRQPIPPLPVLLTLLVLIFGFAIAVSGGPGSTHAADAESFRLGVAASVGSVCCLTLTNTFSKRILSSGVAVHSAELQCANPVATRPPLSSSEWGAPCC